MEDKVKAFLASGKLEEYIYGTLDKKGNKEVFDYIEKYSEVSKEYQVLQNQLEKISRQQAITAPMGMKSQILDSLSDRSQPLASSKIPWANYLAAAAMITSIFFAWAWNEKNTQLQVEKDNYTQLSSECDQREKRINAQNQRIAFLNAEQTQRFTMEGNQLAPNFNAMVFVNEALAKAIVTPTNNFELPKNKCLQLWGDLDGEMIPIAVLNDIKNVDYNLDINPEFTSLNLTIEEKTADGKGQDHPDVSQLISSVTI